MENNLEIDINENEEIIKIEKELKLLEDEIDYKIINNNFLRHKNTSKVFAKFR